jgi:hypothetical protein
MKPIVVSAAKAERAPKAVPSVNAALPCKRRRREILPKSMCLLPLADGPPLIRGFADPAEPAKPYRKGIYRNLRARAILPGRSPNIMKFMCYSSDQILV